MYAYILKKCVPVDNSDGYWDSPDVKFRWDLVGITLSREYASEFFGREISETIMLIFNEEKSVERIEVVG